MSYRLTLLALAFLPVVGCSAQRTNLINSGGVRVEPRSTSQEIIVATRVMQDEQDIVVHGRATLATPGPHVRGSLPHVHIEIVNAAGVVQRQLHTPLMVGPTSRRRLSNLAYYGVRDSMTLPDGAVVRIYLAHDEHDES